MAILIDTEAVELRGEESLLARKGSPAVSSGRSMPLKRVSSAGIVARGGRGPWLARVTPRSIDLSACRLHCSDDWPFLAGHAKGTALFLEAASACSMAADCMAAWLVLNG